MTLAFSACPRHFEGKVARSGYGVVSKAADLEGAHRRGNAPGPLAAPAVPRECRTGGAGGRLETEADEARQREEDVAARLGESLHELAEAQAAMEIESEARRAAEQRSRELKAAINVAKAAFNKTEVAKSEDVVAPCAAIDGADGGARAMPDAHATPEIAAADPVLSGLSGPELAALDQLVATEGHVDRAVLVRRLCLRALVDAGLLPGEQDGPSGVWDRDEGLPANGAEVARPPAAHEVAERPA